MNPVRAKGASMRIGRKQKRVAGRVATAAAAIGLSATLTATGGPAWSATAEAASSAPGRPCIKADSLHAAAVIRQGGECPWWGGPRLVRATTGREEPERDEIPRLVRRARVVPCVAPYVDGNPRLGPVNLPRAGYLHSLLSLYVRFGGLSPSQFLAQYFDPATNNWKFPPNDGYATNSQGQLLKSRITLYPGQLIDRFGLETGRFLASAGTLFVERALPPDSLNTQEADPAHQCNYHLYRVLKAFDTDGGVTAPAFAQPGGGLQYSLNLAYVPGATLPMIPFLVNNGYLQRVY
jgi:Tuberculosis necrotizing toxin